jgi:hypothetical protein
MSTATDEIDALIEGYLAGKEQYRAFSRRFMAIYLEDLSEAEALVYEPAYDILYMGSPGEPRPDERRDGVLGESEIRDKLKDFRARIQRPASA